MRFLLVILLFILYESCTNYSDKDALMRYYKNDIDVDSIVHDSLENTVTRFDDLGYSIDKHWFDANDNLYLYTFYNRYFDTNKAILKVRFDDNEEIRELKGDPFYVSSNLTHMDTLKIDTIKAYIYLANSPFLNPKVNILINNTTRDKKNIVNVKKINHVIYFEDYPDSTLENIEYTFYYTLDLADFNYRDSLNYNCFLKSQ